MLIVLLLVVVSIFFVPLLVRRAIAAMRVTVFAHFRTPVGSVLRKSGPVDVAGAAMSGKARMRTVMMHARHHVRRRSMVMGHHRTVMAVMPVIMGHLGTVMTVMTVMAVMMGVAHFRAVPVRGEAELPVAGLAMSVEAGERPGMMPCWPAKRGSSVHGKRHAGTLTVTCGAAMGHRPVSRRAARAVADGALDMIPGTIALAVVSARAFGPAVQTGSVGRLAMARLAGRFLGFRLAGLVGLGFLGVGFVVVGVVADFAEAGQANGRRSGLIGRGSVGVGVIVAVAWLTNATAALAPVSAAERTDLAFEGFSGQFLPLGLLFGSEHAQEFFVRRGACRLELLAGFFAVAAGATLEQAAHFLAGGGLNVTDLGFCSSERPRAPTTSGSSKA